MYRQASDRNFLGQDIGSKNQISEITVFVLLLLLFY